jgi:hypothetical protein
MGAHMKMPRDITLLFSERDFEKVGIFLMEGKMRRL